MQLTDLASRYWVWVIIEIRLGETSVLMQGEPAWLDIVIVCWAAYGSNSLGSCASIRLMQTGTWVVYYSWTTPIQPGNDGELSTDQHHQLQ
jgi:hypothetical protein